MQCISMISRHSYGLPLYSPLKNDLGLLSLQNEANVEDILCNVMLPIALPIEQRDRLP